MRPRVALVLAIVSILLGGVMLVPAAYARFAVTDDSAADPTATATPESTPPPPPTLLAAPVSVQVDHYFSWALLDRATGKISGSKNLRSTSTTESMVKVWIVADYLRQLGDGTLTEARKQQATKAIRDSDDNAAESLYAAGGHTMVIERMIKICDLTETKAVRGWWSRTTMSSRDAVRMGDCIASGKAAGPKWTTWVLDEMSEVRGTITEQESQQGGGRWGIIDGLPETILSQDLVSIKNGWTIVWDKGEWHVNCLAVTDKWSLAVMMRYPHANGLDYGAQLCATVAAELVSPQPGAALKVPQPISSEAL